MRREEPELVLLDRSAERGTRVVDPFHAWNGREPARNDIAGQVVALELRTRAVRGALEAERVAAVLRDDIRREPGELVLRPKPAGLHSGLLDGELVHEHGPV